jgi:hypothetical protein
MAHDTFKFSLSSILNLKTCQIDYTQAFSQAPFDDWAYMKMPQGWYWSDNDEL